MQGSVDLTGYHVSFDAEFTTAKDLSYFINVYNDGSTSIPISGEVENYTSQGNYNQPGSNYSLQNGELTITAQPSSPGSASYTSGLLNTGYSFYGGPGYYEIRAELPSTAGFWPTFWMLGWDNATEADIAEQPNVLGAGNYFDSLKTPYTPSLTTGDIERTGTDLSSSYHTYGFMWTTTSVQFTFDGQYIGQAEATPAELASLKMELLFNLAVGGPTTNWPGPPAAGATASAKIDYIRAFTNDPTVPAWWAPPEAISSPDGVDTTPNLTGTTTPVVPTPVVPTPVVPTPVVPTPVVPTPVVPTPTVLGGTGSDTLALKMSEDAYLGDAQFTVSVDGKQVGGTQTVTALHSASATQEFDILGSFSTGAHTVTVNFLNDAYGGSSTLDRNLYVNSTTLDGTAIPASSLTEDAGGPQTFSFGKTLPDTLTLGVSEDAYQGDAQYKVLVDGVDTGSTYTATASHAAGAITTQTINGNWGTGAHTIGIQFINDLYAGSPSTDRNLYINSVNYDGDQIGMTTLAQNANGTTNVAVPKTNTLTLQLAEDAYQGDAQFQVSVDGRLINQAATVTASHAAGASQALGFETGLTAGTHDIGVTFLNDAYGGSPSLDRNLYVTGAQLNGTALSSSTWTAAIDTTSTSHFSLVVPS